LNDEIKVVNNGDIKQFVEYVNSILRNPRTMVPLKSPDGNLITDSFAKATLLNNNFATAFTIDNARLP